MTRVAAVAVTAIVLASAVPARAQGGRAAAPIDLTGYWVAVVTQDWRWRMVTPAKGDYAGIPINAAAKKAGDAWDPVKDRAAGEQCRAYGAPAIMHMPTRLRITWRDENTLTVETDAGMQTRVLRFGPPSSSGAATWQGTSTARWARRALAVVTTGARPGYLRRNGVPYSGKAVLTEYWDLFTERSGDQWIMITSTVEDPQYLREPWVTSLHFKKERDGARWDPMPC
jgi:hypothetical protein